jgi:transposase
VDKVEREGLPLSKVAQALRINISTAKLILKKYKETGSFFNKRMCKPKYKSQKKSKKPKQEAVPLPKQKE